MKVKNLESRILNFRKRKVLCSDGEEIDGHFYHGGGLGGSCEISLISGTRFQVILIMKVVECW